MKSLFYPEFEKLIISDQPMPECGDDEVLIKVMACGICGSELESFKNKSTRRMPPRIMGHEFSGVIVDGHKGASGFRAGTPVVSNSIISCGRCRSCKAGRTNLCENRQVFGMERNGAFAEFVNVPVRCLLPFPEGVDFRKTCLTEPLANGVHITKLSPDTSLETILIIGAGPIGLMTQQAFKALREVKIIVADVKQERLDVALKLGADVVLNPLNGNLADQVMEMTSGGGVDMVVDAVGMEITNRQAVDLVRPGGTVVLIGLHADSKSISSYDVILKEKRVQGSYAVTDEDMKEALNLITQNKVDVASWVHYYPLDDGVKAFMDMLQSKNGRIKSVIEIG